MSSPLYREVFKDAWAMFSAHKKLAWFGLLASFIGSASVFNVVIKAFYKLRLDIAPEAPLSYAWAVAVGDSVADPSKVTPIVLGMFIAGVVVIAILLYFLVSAQGALVLASARFEKHRSIRYADAWNDARVKFWPLFAVNVLKGLLILTLFLLMGFPLKMAVLGGAFTVGEAIGMVLYFLILILALILISYIALFAVMYIMVHEMDLGDSIVSAAKLFFNHLLASLEVGAMIFVLDVVATIIIFLAFLVLSVPVAAAAIIGYLFAAKGLSAFVAAALILAFIAIIFFVKAVYTAYAVSVWTSLFLHMDRGVFKSKILRWMGIA